RCKENGWTVELYWNMQDLSTNGKPLPYEQDTKQKHNCPFSNFAIERGYKDQWLKEMQDRFSRVSKPAATSQTSKTEQSLKQELRDKDEVIEEQRIKINELSEALAKTSFAPATQTERQSQAIESQTEAINHQTECINS